MASSPMPLIRPAASPHEAHNIFWPLMQKLHWTRSPHDSHTHYHSTGPSSFLILADPSNPETPEGCIVPLVYANKTGWIGFFCLNESQRGKGWGGHLFAKALDHFRRVGVETVGLDAVSQQVQTYSRRGFVEKAKILVLSRMSTKEKPLDGLERCQHGGRLADLEDIPLDILVRGDCEHMGLERARLWTKEALFSRDDVFGFAVVDTVDGEQKMEGWVLVRGCDIGFRVGPLYAANREVARILLWNVLKRCENQDGQFIAELWAGNPASETVFREAGFETEVVQYHRMWLNGNVPTQQLPGGTADQRAYAIFDAGEG